MPRGSNNKHGSAGRGASNQSNQGFINDGKPEPKSNHARHRSGTKRSEPSPPTADTAANRNQSLKTGKLKAKD